MKFSNFSIKSKFILNLIPLILINILVSFYIYKNGFEEDADFKKAKQINMLVSKLEVEMVTMSDAMKGYVLDPSNEEEYKVKMDADENYGKYAELLSKLSGNNLKIKELNKLMEKFDSEKLNKTENEVLELAKKNKEDALKLYISKYKPLRIEQNKNFEELKKLNEQYSAQIIAEDIEERKSDAVKTIIVLMVATLGGFLVLSFNLKKVLTKTIENVLNFIEISNNISQNANELLIKSKILSDAANLESTAVQETSSSLHEITAMAQRSKDNSELSKEEFRVGRKLTEKGKDNTKKTLDAIMDLNKFQSEIMSVVDEGNKRIAEINTVITNIEAKTKVINEIVFQTKLLSFNASVESARAGEHGKGFAVVAEEIGSLATLSGKASEEINALLFSSTENVNKIIQETQSNLSRTIEKSNSLIKNGVDAAKEAAGLLDDINLSVEKSNRAVEEIATASDEQSRGISEINLAISQLDTSIQENTVVAKETLNKSVELSQLSEELKSKSMEIKQLILGAS